MASEHFSSMPEWATRSLFHYSHEDKHTRSGQERFTEMLGPTVIDKHTRWPLSMSWVAMMIKKLSLKASNNIKTSKKLTVFLSCHVKILVCEASSLFQFQETASPGACLQMVEAAIVCCSVHTHKRMNRFTWMTDVNTHEVQTFFQNLWQKSQHAVALSVNVVSESSC